MVFQHLGHSCLVELLAPIVFLHLLGLLPFQLNFSAKAFLHIILGCLDASQSAKPEYFELILSVSVGFVRVVLEYDVQHIFEISHLVFHS